MAAEYTPAVIAELHARVADNLARWIRDKLFGSIIPEPLIARLESSADPKAEGHRICLELMQEYSDIAGVAGVHLMAPLNESAVPSVIAEFRRQERAHPELRSEVKTRRFRSMGAKLAKARLIGGGLVDEGLFQGVLKIFEDPATPEELERWLGPYLTYEPARTVLSR